MLRKTISLVMSVLMIVSVVCSNVYADSSKPSYEITVVEDYSQGYVIYANPIYDFRDGDYNLYVGDVVILEPEIFSNDRDFETWNVRLTNVRVSTDPTGKNPDASVPVHEVFFNGEDTGLGMFYYIQPASDTYVFFDSVFDNYSFHDSFDAIKMEMYELANMDRQEENTYGIVYCYDKGLIGATGYSPYYYAYDGFGGGYGWYLYEPNRYFTRGELWTLLARYQQLMSEEFGVKYNTTTDFNWYATYERDDWWAEGRRWAMTNGYTDGTNYQDYVTKEQVLEMLYRCDGMSDDWELSGDECLLDYNQVHDWALNGVNWALSYGLVRAPEKMLSEYYGYDGNYFFTHPAYNLKPTGYVTRAEVASIIYRAIIRVHVTNCLWDWPSNDMRDIYAWYYD